MNYKIVVGLEVHDQPLAGSKMFSSCSANYTSAPLNTHVCLGCLGMPSTLPVINGKAVKLTVLTDLALNCTIPEYTKFGRKNYFYPDVMKGYHIPHCDIHIGRGSWLSSNSTGAKKQTNVTKVHIEGDVAKFWHWGNYSLTDANRSGIPLMEFVRETRRWVEEQGMTVSVRVKECAEDYRYLPKLDLHPMAVDRAWIEETGARPPELPEARRDRFMTQYSLCLYDANILTSSRNHGRLF